MARKITIELTLEDGGFTRKVVSGAGALDKFSAATDKAGSRLDKAEKKTKSFGSSLRDLTITVGLARSAILNLRAVTLDWVGAIIKTNAEIERMGFLMEGMSKSLTKVGRQKEARENIAWLFKTAKQTPFAINALTDSFVKMKSVGLDPTNGSLRALTDSVANFGGNSELLKRASISIQQMAGKGVVSMEELRQQMGEAIPRAIELMARSMGVTYGELVTEIATGTVEAKNALANLFAEMERTFGGQGEAMMLSFEGQLSKMSTLFQELAKEVGDTGFFTMMRDQLLDLNRLLESPLAKVWARDLGKALMALTVELRGMVTWIWDNQKALISIAKIFGVLLGYKVIVGLLASMKKGWISLAPAVGLAKSAHAGFSKVWSAQWVTMKTGRAQLAMTGGAWMRLWRTVKFATIGIAKFTAKGLLALAGPVGIAIGIIWSLIDVFGLLGSSAKSAWEEIAKGPEGNLSSGQLEDAKEEVADLREELLLLEEGFKRKSYGKVQKVQRSGSGFMKVGGYDGGNEAATKRRAELKEQILKRETALERYHAGETQKIMDKSSEQFKIIMNDRLKIVHTTFDAEQLALRESLKKQDITQAEFNEGIKASRAKNYADRLTVLEEAARAEKKIIDQSSRAGKGFGLETAKAKTNLKVIAQLKLRLLEAIQLGKDASGELEKILNGKDKGAKKKESAYERKLTSLKTAFAGLSAQIKGEGPQVAKVLTQIAEGVYGKLSQEKIDIMIKAADAVDQQTQAKKELAEAEKAAAKSSAWLSKNLNKEIEINAQLLTSLNGAEQVWSKSLQTKLANIEAERKLISLTKESIMTGEEKYAAQLELNQLEKTLKANELLRNAKSLQDETRSIRTGLLPKKKAIQAEFDHKMTMLDKQLEAVKGMGDAEKKIATEVAEHKKALQEQLTEDLKTPLQQQFEDWADTQKAMEQASAKFMNSFVDQMIDNLASGKMEWGDFAESVLKEIIRIQMRASMANIAALLMGNGGSGGSGGGLLGGLFSTAGSVFSAWMSGDTAGGTAGPGPYGGTVFYHGGGIAGGSGAFSRQVSDSVWAGAPRYHTGGIASNEVPAVLEKGEGIFTKEQMKALGGNSGGGDVQINIINQSGTQVEGKQEGKRFDGRQVILDVVLEATSKPGGFRDGMKGAMS